ncbi:hypothetical protein QBC47DRAFT_418833 [Echria macrotheca]|uniref:Uncharacterized protein n=1 Tax=Echria macrotheca TaxID=438768 RepID=A0AAJ0B0V6_9PEZI|nr:hypothetical protein QBC47DRAFT_418833 [Echria macrotheca]
MADESRIQHHTIANMALATEPNANGLSIAQLLSTHPREQLFVHPLMWTARHLELLRCGFVDGGIIKTPGTSPPPADRAPADDCDDCDDDGDDGGDNHDEAAKLQRYLAYLNGEVLAAQRLAACRGTISKQNALLRLVPGLKHRRDGIQFLFGRRAVADLPCSSFSYTPQSPSQPTPPAHLVYLDLSDMERCRRSKLLGAPPPPGIPRRRNLPLTRRSEKQLRRIRPGKRYEDPYIAALLIALAQDQRHCEKGSDDYDDDDDNDGNPSGAANAAPLQMLLANGYDADWLYIYTTKVSTELLDMLNRPSYPLPANAQPGPGMVIYRQRLAFTPYNTLSQRLSSFLQHASSLGEHSCCMEGGVVGQVDIT